MVRIPIYENKRALNTGSQFFRTINNSGGRALARGIGQFAGGLARLGGALEAKQRTTDRFASESALLDFGQRADTVLKESATNIPEDGAGFTQNVAGVLAEDMEATLAGLPEDMRAKAELKLRSKLYGTVNQAHNLEIKQGQTFISAVATRKTEAVRTAVSEGLMTRDQATEEFETLYADLDLPENKMEMLRKNANRQIELGLLTKMVREDPNAVLSDVDQFKPTRPTEQAGPVQRYIIDTALAHGIDPTLMLTIAKIESNFNPNTKASKTMSGLFQISRAERRRLGIPESQRFDIKSNTLAYVKLFGEHKSKLQRMGLPVTPQNVWGMHFLGAGGFTAFHKAMKQNPNADAYSVYARVAGPRIASMAFSQNGRRLRRGYTVKRALDEINSYVAKGQVGVSKYVQMNAPEKNINADGTFKIAGETFSHIEPEDVAEYYATAKKSVASRDQAEINDKLRRLVQPGGAFNPYSDADRKVADDISKDEKVDEAIIKGDVEAIKQATSYAEQGYIPQGYAEGLEAVVRNPQASNTVKQQSYQALVALHNSNPREGLKLTRLQPSTRKRVEDVAELAKYDGMKINEAVQRVEDLERVKESKEHKDLVKARISELETKGTITGLRFSDIEEQMKRNRPAWYERIFGTDGDAYYTSPQTRLGFQAKYQERFRDHMYLSNGDPKIAQARALADLEKRYNVSRVTAKSTGPNGTLIGHMAVYPVEQVYPSTTGTSKDPSEMTDDEIKNNYGYIEQQAKLVIEDKLGADAAKKVNGDNIRFIATPETEADIERGDRFPRYMLAVVRGDNKNEVEVVDTSFEATLDESPGQIGVSDTDRVTKPEGIDFVTEAKPTDNKSAELRNREEAFKKQFKKQ